MFATMAAGKCAHWCKHSVGGVLRTMQLMSSSTTNAHDRHCIPHALCNGARCAQRRVPLTQRRAYSVGSRDITVVSLMFNPLARTIARDPDKASRLLLNCKWLNIRLSGHGRNLHSQAECSDAGRRGEDSAIAGPRLVHPLGLASGMGRV